MNVQTNIRGAAPVGYIAELDPIEAGAVIYLRLWCAGSETRLKMISDFEIVLGHEQGQKAIKAFDTLYSLCVHHGRRPLLHHQVNCKCLGADESCFANFIGYASEGNREDALLIATNLIRPGMAAQLVNLAQDFGIALRLMTIKLSNYHNKTTTIH
ncbi:MAG: hypothetical protein OXC62_07935 [Aestuariivita sp.]|nr:hypothetical protein [Aestuariivita sp.]